MLSSARRPPYLLGARCDDSYSYFVIRCDGSHIYFELGATVLTSIWGSVRQFRCLFGARCYVPYVYMELGATIPIVMLSSVRRSLYLFGARRDDSNTHLVFGRWLLMMRVVDDDW